MRLLRVRAGAIAIGHRPRVRAMPLLRQAGVTHIATILSEREDPFSIERAARAAALEWVWIPLGSTKSLPARAKPEVSAALAALTVILDAGGVIYLHCSAGIHRTGMITAALLFHLGSGESEVREKLTYLRPVTAEGVGEGRIEWARSFAHPT